MNFKLISKSRDMNIAWNIVSFLQIYLLILFAIRGSTIFLKIIMEISKQSFKIGQCVYAKMKFFAPWPALILEIQGQVARVQFFGWQNQW